MDVAETNNSLVDFVSTATSNLKFTLGRPLKAKRKVNHRKYLQRQLKGRTGCYSSNSSAVLKPYENGGETQNGKNINKIGQAAKSTRSEQLQHVRPTFKQENNWKTIKTHKPPELVNIEQVMSAVRVPGPPMVVSHGMKSRKTSDNIVPCADPVKLTKQEHQAQKHSGYYAYNNHEHNLHKNNELFEWFGPEFDDLLERWSEESSWSDGRGSETSSATDPYSPNSNNSENGSPFDESFYEQLMWFHPSTSNFKPNSMEKKR